MCIADHTQISLLLSRDVAVSHSFLVQSSRSGGKLEWQPRRRSMFAALRDLQASVSGREELDK